MTHFDHLDPAQRERLAKQARELAAVRDEETGLQQDQAVDLLVFSLSGERYAVEAQWVEEAVCSVVVTPVPCTPDHILGAAMLRGRLAAVVDLAGVLGLPKPEAAGCLVLLSGRSMEMALAVDQVHGTVRVEEHQLRRDPANKGGKAGEYALSLAPGLVAVLDGEKMLTDASLAVNETVGD